MKIGDSSADEFYSCTSQFHLSPYVNLGFAFNPPYLLARERSSSLRCGKSTKESKEYPPEKTNIRPFDAAFSNGAPVVIERAFLSLARLERALTREGSLEWRQIGDERLRGFQADHCQAEHRRASSRASKSLEIAFTNIKLRISAPIRPDSG